MFAEEHASVTYVPDVNGRNGKRGNGNGSGVRFGFCPYCGRKGFYKVPRQYERCRCCGLHRMLMPGQDF